MTDFDDTILRAALAPARNLKPTDHEVACAIESARCTPTRRRPRAYVLALVAAILLSGSAYAVPTTRAAIEDITSPFAAWIAGDEDGAPGRAVDAGDEAPEWVEAGEGRLIAKTDGVPLYVTRIRSEARGTLLGFSLGDTKGSSIAVFDTVEGWRDRFGKHAVVVLGALPAQLGPEPKRFPLLGVTARSVEHVELRYTSGPSLTTNAVEGGFVLMADATRSMSEIVAYAGDGRALDRADVSKLGDPAPSTAP